MGIEIEEARSLQHKDLPCSFVLHTKQSYFYASLIASFQFGLWKRIVQLSQSRSISEVGGTRGLETF